MEKKLLENIKFYGINHQQRKLEEEIFELQEAIIKHENENPIIKLCEDWNKCLSSAIGKKYKKNSIEIIEKELADCYSLLEQIRLYYGISKDTIKENLVYKTNRQEIRRQKEKNKNEN